jgi:acyl-CoA thioester hydrolase
MPLTHQRTFRVRHYECDAYGHVNDTNYLRYMQEAAFDASAAVGYDLARYQAMGRHWLVHETDVEYLHPLRYGDSVQVKTWVADFRRIRSRRRYEFRLAGNDDLIAQAQTDWVFLDTATQLPTPIPPEMVNAFLPEGSFESHTGSNRFPTPPPPPPGVFKMRRRVEWRDIDPAGHVNNAVYLSYIEDCGLQVVAAHGWPIERTVAEGFAMVARKHHIQYLNQAVLDDELELATWASNIKRTSAVRHFTISRVSDGELLTRARTVWVWVDVKTDQPIRIPSHFLADFATNIV